ncbi:MAG: RNA methyltransferase [Actinobacteria bacterium]|nr:RNA methyltransferase [Actinomycetota bacterium]NIU21752.1 RNA methyltransferase [Actinomycetota bacterium]
MDGWAHIDMPGHAESLNVAMAGTLLAYEAAKGR